jgi:hypothetical protein
MPQEPKGFFHDLFSARVLGAAVVVAILIAGVGFGVDHLVHRTSRLYASDLYTLLVAFVLSYAVMMYEKRRRAMLLRRMMVAAEVNHHIRNALTAVVFKASVQSDPELQAVIEDAAARVDWVLTTVLPDGSKDLKWPVQAPDWHAATWRSGKPQAER